MLCWTNDDDCKMEKFSGETVVVLYGNLLDYQLCTCEDRGLTKLLSDILKKINYFFNLYSFVKDSTGIRSILLNMRIMVRESGCL